MKRRRKSRDTDSNQKPNHIQIDYSGPSFLELPKDILLNILCRLVTKPIFVCKSVCKTWHDLISNPEFEKLYFDESRYQLKLDMFDNTFSNSGCVSNVKIKLDTIFDSDDRSYNVLAPNYLCIENEYSIVNSCNGLLCLSHVTDGRPVIICNPITREFIHLPQAEKVGLCLDISYGFYFSHIVNKYKVVRMTAHARSGGIGKWKDKITAQVHIVGTESWRKIDSKPEFFVCRCPTYLNGCLYWSCCLHPLSIIAFDIENESFGLDLGPEVDRSDAYQWDSVGVLGGELCISVITNFQTLHVWAMKGSGVEKGWSKVISMDMHSYGKPINDSLQPMKYLDDGSLLMFYYPESVLVHVDPQKCRFRFLKIHRKKLKVAAVVVHAPSLVSLKHSLSEYNVKVLNFRSRVEVTPTCQAKCSYSQKISRSLKRPMIFV